MGVENELGLDPTLPDVELILCGKTYKLAFDFNAIVRAEKETGINLLSAIVKDITASSLRGMLWSAMLKYTPSITIDAVGAMITPFNVATIRDAITTAWFGSIKDQESSGEAEAQS